jgi:membrane protein implicated in regulation of membrane protease activity
MISVSMTFVWLAAMIALLIVEAMVPGLVSIWFALGALAAMISAALGAPLWLQVLWFFLISIVSLLLTRPLARKVVNARTVRTNADMAIGQDCVVTEAIDNIAGTGAVTVGGQVWTARSVSDAVIPSETRAVVRRIEGVKLIVEPHSENPNI